MTLPSHPWLGRILDYPAVDAICRRLSTPGNPRVVAQGSYGSSTSLLTAAVALRLSRPLLLVVAHLDDTDDALDDLELLRAAGLELPTSRFSALEILPGESGVSLELLAERLELVRRMSGPNAALGTAQVIVAPIQALMQSVPEPEVLGNLTQTIRVGDTIPQGKLFAWLTDAGYERVDPIEQSGQFAARGGIVDIYPPVAASPAAGDEPIRLDYLGDQIESICRIDPDTMGSGAQLDEVRIVGANIQTRLSDEQTTNFLSVLPADVPVLMHEVMELGEQARGYYERLTDPIGIYPPASVFKAITARPHIEVNQYGASVDKAEAHSVPVRPLGEFDHDAAKAVKEVAQLAASGDHDSVVVLCTKPAERIRLNELIAEHVPGQQANLTTEVGYLHRGFIWGDAEQSVALVPHHELFRRYEVRRRIHRIGVAAGTRPSDAFLEVDAGDYVVHTDHGIGRFVGLRTMTHDDKNQEFLTLEFANKAHLHVPATQIDLVQKYVGGFHGRPPLSLLGGKRWSRQKEQATEAVRDMAGELLRVQAARQTMPGVGYPADTAWQKEFEAEFPYEETPDQLAALVETKKDMAKPQPMDRLICGDVGFGKTEIAIRAAFKAIEYGKQVAVLVPTTVLAEQHERTFRDRMADYPFRIETLSRFKTAKQIKKTIKGLSQGEVDVVVGTHRLLSDDVRFADLGMVVIDEEQRFGVEHKNKLLQFRLTADVMTLSATPIPRTLHMSMLGLRDISSLTTAPLDRRAIVTEVVPFDKHRIRQAIIRELNRQGQVYFVHNRVYNIQSVADEVQALVPEARVAIGHGQMPDRQLEQVMISFLRRDIDVLVCTTIIESGLDIASTNTILINNADHFGLADLHQLRGRVGRYKHRAYCYLLLPENRPIAEKAARRLQAIEQYTMLGAGFRIAMRDLEIRGAGNLLGTEQSGHIAAVGYEMYCRLLEHEARRLRNERIIEPIKTHLELPIAGRLPASYIKSDRFRMETYRRLSRAATLDELEAVVKDMTTAYGPPPTQAQALVDLTELRIATSALQVRALKLDGPDLIFRTDRPQKLDPLLSSAAGRVSIIDDKTVYYRPPASYLDPPSTLITVLRKLLVAPIRQGVIKADKPIESPIRTPLP